MCTQRCKGLGGVFIACLATLLVGTPIESSNGPLWSIAGIALGQSGIADPDAVGGLLSNPAGLAKGSFFVEWQPKWEQGNPTQPQRWAITLDRVGYAHVQQLEGNSLVTHQVWGFGQQANDRLEWGIRSHQRIVGDQRVWTMDVGVLFQALPYLKVGGVAYQWMGDQPNDQAHYQVGLAWHGHHGQWRWTLDGQQQPGNEWLIINGLTLLIRDDMHLRVGVHPRQLTGGVGMMIGDLWFDYAFEAPFSGANKTHALSLRLGGHPRPTQPEAL